MDSELSGLQSTQIDSNRAEHGPNSYEFVKPKSTIRFFFENLLTPFGVILIGATIISFYLGEILEASIIGIVILVNAILGTYQEAKSERIIESLQKVLKHQVTVVRDNKKIDINASEVVYGDIVFLKSGGKVPADGRVVESSQLTISEALLTGESRPIKKELNDEVFSGTIVTGGLGYMKVTKVGLDTEFGKIASSATANKKDKSPLQRKLILLSYQILIGLGIVISIISLIGYISGIEPIELFETAVALAVSAIPEALTISVTMALAISLNRLLKQNALIRKLITAETLGSVTTICLDKTGTITRGEMEVVDAIFEENDRDYFYDALKLNNQEINAVDIAISEFLKDYSLSSTFEIQETVPFNSKNKFALTKTGSATYAVGAPEILARGNHHWKKRIEEYTKDGSRVVGVSVSPKQKSRIDSSFRFIGLVIITDPIRKDIPKHFVDIQSLGLEIKIITGDLKETATKVAKDAGIDLSIGKSISGKELQMLSKKELSSQIRDITLFYRTTPDQKLRIVNALKANGEVVAMMGDGVNDSPALRKADIGIVVDNATDISREVADFVLLKNSFSIIPEGIKEGRALFRKIQNITAYLLTESFTELFLIGISIVLGLPLPLIPVQILFLNLITDGLPDLALAFEKGHLFTKHIGENIISRKTGSLIAFIALLLNSLTFGIFYFLLTDNVALPTIQTIIFMIIAVSSLLYVFSFKSIHMPIYKVNLLDNRFLLFSVILSMILTVGAVYTPIVNDALGLVPLPYQTLIWIVLYGLLQLLLIEITKYILNRE